MVSRDERFGDAHQTIRLRPDNQPADAAPPESSGFHLHFSRCKEVLTGNLNLTPLLGSWLEVMVLDAKASGFVAAKKPAKGARVYNFRS